MGIFLGFFMIWVMLEAILDWKYYSNPQKPLHIVSLGSWEVIRMIFSGFGIYGYFIF